MHVSEPISESKIRNRIIRNNISAFNSSTHSPIAEIEKCIAETIIQMAKVKNPLSIPGCIQLANSMIEETNYQSKLVKFKNLHKLSHDFETLGKAWFRGFLKRKP